jgi:hypothetical protein
MFIGYQADKEEKAAIHKSEVKTSITTKPAPAPVTDNESPNFHLQGITILRNV